MRKVINLNVGTVKPGGDYNKQIDTPDDWSEWSEDKQQKFIEARALEFMRECCEWDGWTEMVKETRKQRFESCKGN